MDARIWTAILLCCISTLHAQTVNSTHGLISGQTTTVLGKPVHVFHGIPFAKPPINTLRFKHPLPAEPWYPDVKNATTQKASCYQDIPHKRNPLEQLPSLVSEDCLYLNIFAPPSSPHGAPKAVMVWLYGGGFSSGSINAPMFDGGILASVNDVVVVTVNYRLGVLGFLYLDANTVPGNMGLMDQRLAIKWVYENSHNFGGDSSRITIFGQSAGGGSVSHHLLSPLSQPFFTSAIIESGSPLTSWDLLTDREAKTNANAIAKKAKCSPRRTNVEIYECLNNKKAGDLVNLQNGLVQGANVAFGPVVDGSFLPDRPLAILEKGAVKNASVLLGVNENEGALFLYYGHPTVFKWQDNLSISDAEFMADLDAQGKIQGGSNMTVRSLYQEYVLSRVESERDYVSIADEVLGDYAFKCPVTRFAGFLATSSPTYLYSFNHRLQSATVPKWMGVKHGGELPLVWGHALDPNVNLTFTDDEKTLSRVMMSYWTNFAKFGNPNGENSSLTQWPRFETMHERYLQLDVGSSLATSQGLRRRQCVFLYQTVPLVASLEKHTPKADTTSEPCIPPVGGQARPTPAHTVFTTALLVVWIAAQIYY
ncbi:cholinesterase-like [Haliotis cracherodii]|uniref:cholinesterase-like n=1 Tax=Haliotis cracherodii TaxID=6455 RepID=UPI0039EC03BB